MYAHQQYRAPRQDVAVGHCVVCVNSRVVSGVAVPEALLDDRCSQASPARLDSPAHQRLYRSQSLDSVEHG